MISTCSLVWKEMESIWHGTTAINSPKSTILVFLLQCPREPRELSYLARDTTIFRCITINIEVRRYSQLNKSSICAILFPLFLSDFSSCRQKKLMAFESVCTCFQMCKKLRVFELLKICTIHICCLFPAFYYIAYSKCRAIKWAVICPN